MSVENSDNSDSNFSEDNEDNISNNKEELEKIYKKPITFGICSRFFLFILGAGSFKLLSLLILGANSIFEDGIGLFGFCPILYMLYYIWIYLPLFEIC